ncbi:MAG: fumarylacetoacetate hydrolase family protein [Burkholderiaceae bacterium]
MNDDSKRELAKLLAALRRERRQQSGLQNHLVPPTEPLAYEVARLVEVELAKPVLGWKVAAMKEEMQRQLRAHSPIYGRVFDVFDSPAAVDFETSCSPIPEVEYQAVLGHDLPPRASPYTRDEVVDAVASMHPGLELAECRFVHDERFPPLAAILADGAGSGAVVLGPAIENWRDRDLAGQEVVLRCNGQARRQGTARAALDHPIEPLVWLANELSRTGIGLKAGQVVSTGTLTGMLRPRQGDVYTADYGEFGTVSVTYR